MRSIERDKRTIYYSLFLGKTAVTVDGKRTGEYTLSYGTPTALEIDYSAGSDTLSLGEYGIKETYDRTMTTHDLACPIAEDTRIWIGISTSLPHNYVVAAKQDSKRAIKYGLTKVKVSAT